MTFAELNEIKKAAFNNDICPPDSGPEFEKAMLAEPKPATMRQVYTRFIRWVSRSPTVDDLTVAVKIVLGLDELPDQQWAVDYCYDPSGRKPMSQEESEHMSKIMR